MTATATASKDSMIYTVTAEQRTALLSNDPTEFQAAFDTLFSDIQVTFDDQGLVLVRGLLDEEPLQRLCEDGQVVADSVKMGSTFTSLKFGPIFCFPDADEKEVVSGQAFRDVALRSAIPAFIARVLMPDEETSNHGANVSASSSSLHLLKDCFMAKGKEQNYCGWHVDDAGFWPTDAQSNGVNVWVALDEMPAKYGGGLAVSPQSHKAEWRQQAYKTIGSTQLFPPEGVAMKSTLFQQVFGKTCTMSTLDPALHERIETSRVEFDYQRGDCLFCTRWLFHRSVPINEEGLTYYNNQTTTNSNQDEPTLKRYTIRYERGTARLMRGLNVETSVLVDETNAGKSLDEINGPYYPQCWPTPTDPQQQETEMQTLVTDAFPKAEVKRQVVIKEMQEFLAKPNTGEEDKNEKKIGY